MIATDSSTFIAYLNGEDTQDTNTLDQVLTRGDLIIPSFVISEVLSARDIEMEQKRILLSFPTLEILENFWIRAGQSRSLLLRKKLKAKLIDTFIAQSCIDHNIPLITRDKDFRHYKRYCGLKLV